MTGRKRVLEVVEDHGVYLMSFGAIWDSLKFQRLCRRLDIDELIGFACLHSLWHHAQARAPDGVLEGYSALDVAVASRWRERGGEQRWLDALLAEGFLHPSDDGALILHEWMQYGGAALAKRAAQAAARRRQRKAKREREAAEAAAAAATAEAPVSQRRRATNAGCRSDVARQTPNVAATNPQITILNSSIGEDQTSGAILTQCHSRADQAPEAHEGASASDMSRDVPRIDQDETVTAQGLGPHEKGAPAAATPVVEREEQGAGPASPEGPPQGVRDDEDDGFRPLPREDDEAIELLARTVDGVCTLRWMQERSPPIDSNRAIDMLLVGVSAYRRADPSWRPDDAFLRRFRARLDEVFPVAVRSDEAPPLTPERLAELEQACARAPPGLVRERAMALLVEERRRTESRGAPLRAVGARGLPPATAPPEATASA